MCRTKPAYYRKNIRSLVPASWQFGKKLLVIMAARKQLSRQEADEDPVTFCDVVARFSEDEWKLLHLWQKDLYRNVMKEIHKVLITLGPLIATSVFSLKPIKPKKKEGLCPQELCEGDRINPFSGDSVITSDNILRVDEEFELDSVKPCVSEDGGSSTDPTLAPDVKPPLTSIGINEEGETYHMGVQEYQRGESPEVKPPVAPIGFNEEGETYRIGSQPYRRGEYLELKPAVAFTGIKEEEETPPIGIQDYPRGESSNSLGNRNKNGKRKGSISLKHHVSESFCKSVTKKSVDAEFTRMKRREVCKFSKYQVIGVTALGLEEGICLIVILKSRFLLTARRVLGMLKATN
ncbi:hypothetical protein NDU88_005260 [Pleurodeles waltl]|uniref:KRAB domain-containing protein n=1 Tax=Pleurodeles waltl TaxID=8319 RepID=A0AAV7T9W7_PLEWA|nr:hypothetical protein NDU88_005260 [Pleurodeles waltl]